MNDYCLHGRSPSECAERITKVILFLAWRRTFHILSSLQLNLTSLGSTLFVLMLFAAVMLPSGITVIFKLQELKLLPFHSGIVQNLFSITPKTLFLIENVISFLFFFFVNFLAFCKKMSILTMLLP